MNKSEQKQLSNVIVWLVTFPYTIWISKKLSPTLKVVAISAWTLVIILGITVTVSGLRQTQTTLAQNGQNSLANQGTPEVAGISSSNSSSGETETTVGNNRDQIVAQLINSKEKKLFDVVKVVDGDTIKISELGTLRLIGIDTPETMDPRKPVQCFGKEASDRAKKLLTGTKVYLEFDPGNRVDKYNRTLAYVYREDGYFYNLETVRDGYAHSYVQYPHPKLDEFNQAQKEAREAKRGFWSSDTCNGDTVKSSS